MEEVEPNFQTSFIFQDSETQTKIGLLFFKMVKFTVNCKRIVNFPRIKLEFQRQLNKLMIFKNQFKLCCL